MTAPAIEITDRVRVEQGRARRRATATLPELAAVQYAVAASDNRPQGFRLAPEFGPGIAVRSYGSDGCEIKKDESFQYLSRERVFYVYVLRAVRILPCTGRHCTGSRGGSFSCSNAVGHAAGC